MLQCCIPCLFFPFLLSLFFFLVPSVSLQTSSTISLISEPSPELVPSSADADSSDSHHSLAVLCSSKHPSASHSGDLAAPTSAPSAGEGSHVVALPASGHSAAPTRVPSLPQTVPVPPPRVSSAARGEQLTSAGLVRLSRKPDSSRKASQAVPASSMEFLCRSDEVEAQGLELAKESEKKEQRTDPKISSVPISNTGQGNRQIAKDPGQQGAFRDNSALPSQGKSVETALDELWALELAEHLPEVHAKHERVLSPVCEPSVMALDRRDIFPDTKKQLGFVVEQGQELKAPREIQVDGCPDLGQKRQSRGRTPRKSGAATMTKARGEQENEQFTSSVVAPQPPENLWKTDWDQLHVSKPPIERISASGQARTARMREQDESRPELTAH